MKTALFASCALAIPSAAFGESPVGPGEPAPIFQLRALDNALVKLADISYPGPERSWAKKSVVLLDFFRTDCAPCIKSMPDLIGLHRNYRDKGLEVIVVALLEEQDGRAKLESYLTQNPLPFRVVVDASDHVAKKYLGKNVKLPATFLIDRDGKILAAKHGAEGTLETSFGGAIAKAIAPSKDARVIEAGTKRGL